MFYTIYRITNLIDNKIYIGLHKTRNLDDGYMGSGKRIKAAQKKYGLENFKKEILFIFDNEKDMIAKEIEIVTTEFCLREDTYNLAKGGGDGWSYANLHGKSNIGWKTNGKNENHLKGGNSLWEKIRNDEKFKEDYFRKKNESFKINYSFLGKSHTEETKLKISQANSTKQMGSLNSQYGTIWITDGFQSMKIKNNEEIPSGWYKGRKILVANKGINSSNLSRETQE